jgi:mediator of RNA polymerase II transcription subunit 12
MPMKTALPESKNEVWIADLANPHVPLGKLAQIGVPQDLKGHELLDMLHSKNIPVPRAVWYIRVLGANETVSYHRASLRNKLDSYCLPEALPTIEA